MKTSILFGILITNLFIWREMRNLYNELKWLGKVEVDDIKDAEPSLSLQSESDF